MNEISVNRHLEGISGDCREKKAIGARSFEGERREGESAQSCSWNAGEEGAAGPFFTALIRDSCQCEWSRGGLERGMREEVSRACVLGGVLFSFFGGE